MKKYILPILLIFTISATSCGIFKSKSKVSIVGEWLVDYESLPDEQKKTFEEMDEEQKKMLKEMLEKMIFRYKDDGTYEIVMDEIGSEGGTWLVEDNYLFLTQNNNEKEEKIEIVTLTKDKLVLKKDKEVISFKRKE